jgi:hypothetical protein
MKICHEIINLVKIGQKLRTLNEQLRSVSATVAGEIISPEKRSLRVKRYRVFNIAEEVKILCERDTMLRYTFTDYRVYLLFIFCSCVFALSKHCYSAFIHSCPTQPAHTGLTFAGNVL